MAQIKLRRMTDAARQTITFAAGEPCWTTDTKKMWCGDGVTAGGIAVDTTGGAAVTVENVLTSTSTTTALSAAQGKALKTQVDSKANADLSNVTGTLPVGVVAQLKGADGQDGVDGKSAYQSWLDAGNTGTESDFLTRTAASGKRKFFIASGSYTPSSNTIYVTGCGGGGSGAQYVGGASNGGGGGGGSCVYSKKLTVTSGTAYAVTIGAGGVAKDSSLSGDTGGVTSFGSLLTLLGGGGGGNYGAPGSAGGCGGSDASTYIGGSSRYGCGGNYYGSGGINGSGYGAGGGGAIGAILSGAGTGGFLLIEEGIE